MLCSTSDFRSSPLLALPSRPPANKQLLFEVNHLFTIHEPFPISILLFDPPLKERSLPVPDLVLLRLLPIGEPESLLAGLFDFLDATLPTEAAGDALPSLLPDLPLPDRADLGLPECLEGDAGDLDRVFDLDLELFDFALTELADRDRAAFGEPFSEPEGLADRLDFGLPDGDRVCCDPAGLPVRDF